MLVLASASPRRKELLSRPGTNSRSSPPTSPKTAAPTKTQPPSSPASHRTKRNPSSTSSIATHPKTRSSSSALTPSSSSMKKSSESPATPPMLRLYFAAPLRTHSSSHHQRLPDLQQTRPNSPPRPPRSPCAKSPRRKSPPTSLLASQWTKPEHTPSRATPPAGFLACERLLF